MTGAYLAARSAELHKAEDERLANDRAVGLIHIIKAGFALCGRAKLDGVPIRWPVDRSWVSEDVVDATCEKCWQALRSGQY